MLRVAVQAEDFDVGRELAALNGVGVGGIGSFIGVVRGAPVTALHLEFYPGMTERAVAKIAAEAMQRWPLLGCTLIHRVGTLRPGDNIVFVGAASAHRAPALAATAFLIDWLKTAAPLWKREEFSNGDSAWVAPCQADVAAATVCNREG